MRRRCELTGFFARSGRAAGLAIAACTLAALPASAAPVANDQEVQAAAGLFHAQGSDVGTLSADVSYGYFFNPVVELGIRQAGNYSFVDDARDRWLLSTAPFLNLHWNQDPDQLVVPYLGMFVGAVYNDVDVTGALGPQVGLKFFLNQQTFLNVAYRYEWFWNQIEQGGLTDEADDGNHVGTVGIGFVFGGDRPSIVRTTYDESIVTRSEDAARRSEDAATRTESAARRIEDAANQAERSFDRNLRK